MASCGWAACPAARRFTPGRARAGGWFRFAGGAAGGTVLDLGLRRPLWHLTGAQLVTQHPGLDLFDLPGFQQPQLERAIAHPYQPVHDQTDMVDGAADFTVLAFADSDCQPGIGGLT